jgi:hypothetical protein
MEVPSVCGATPGTERHGVTGRKSRRAFGPSGHSAAMLVTSTTPRTPFLTIGRSAMELMGFSPHPAQGAVR